MWPSSNEEYWHKKIDRNVERDMENYEALEKMGWRVIVIWECELKRAVGEENLAQLYDKITE